MRWTSAKMGRERERLFVIGVAFPLSLFFLCVLFLPNQIFVRARAMTSTTNREGGEGREEREGGSERERKKKDVEKAAIEHRVFRSKWPRQ